MLSSFVSIIKTTIAYRKDKFSRVNETNLSALWELEKHNKIKVRLNHDITEIDNESGKVRVHYENGKIRVYDRVVLCDRWLKSG